MNDCLPVSPILLQRHDQHNLPGTLDTALFDSEESYNYKLISSMKMDKEYNDPDNPTVLSTNAFDGENWDLNDNQQWIPPNCDSQSPTLPSILTYVNNIDTKIPSWNYWTWWYIVGDTQSFASTVQTIQLLRILN